ncbi:MAG: bifunctional (p)ppGpp synthetase/guanosine-3',5'-bis(diphosphate) 3'-pyrophosphohydrolase, partial [Ktedonobacterales bacterium]|nr:bifunctional (p)ppGpp synthetase/guanosine-3',5'-bis(diphosphate) 3'-pyrophosphohydrolase [Ktedonobacterales bacterium]
AGLNGAATPDAATGAPRAPGADATSQRERKASAKLETVRKLFLAMSQDPRVVLLKLADRLHNMRTLESMSAAQRLATSRETLDIFAPLAGRVGLHLFKTELEDLAFSYLEPEAWAHTVQRLREVAERHAGWAARMCATIQRELAARGIVATVNWRVKRPYRAYSEALDSGMALSMLHDLIAFRVLVTGKDDCYHALGIIHHLWHPHDTRIRDYIANPKVNGYQSLHTGVFALDGQLAQIHIRTHEMHRAAQHGVAAYWLERAARRQPVDGATPINVEQMLGWVTQIAAWHHELDLSAADFVAAVRGELFDEQVFVFTPKGDIRELPDGSTVLDFAYAIHTQIGDHATGAHVQTNSHDGLLVSRDVSLDYVLRRGDVVRVLTDAGAWPRPEYLAIARTRYA